MSLVSDAHRRANGQAVTVDAQDSSISTSKWVLSLALAMAIGSVATVWLINADFTARKNTVLPHTQVAASGNAQISDKSEPFGSEGHEDTVPPEPSVAVIALYDRAIAERERIAQQSSKQVVPPGSSRTQLDEATERLQPQVTAPEEARAISQSVDGAQLLARAQSLLANSQRDAVLNSALPTLETLAEEARDRVPTLLYSAHDYRGEGGSKVMINREWWSEGQQINGIKVIEIREKSTVFETQGGTRFLQPALSSWVNL